MTGVTDPELLLVPQAAASRLAGLHGVLEPAGAGVGVARVAGHGGEYSARLTGARFAEGQGRVFTTAPGHFPAAWESPAYLRHLPGGLEWVLDRSDDEEAE